jgi:predicted metal-binding protein
VISEDGRQCGQTHVQMLMQAAVEVGFTHAAPLKTETLRFLTEVRQMCNQDRCRHYNMNWMCPPACGTLEECAAKAVV